MKRLCLKYTFLWALAAGALGSLVGCSSSSARTLKVAATAVPHADILNHIKDTLAGEGIELKIIEVDDYNLPNRLLAEKQVDANFFQHIPFLELQNKQFGYHLVVLTKVHIEPLGVYSEQLGVLDALSECATVALPSDPTNEARALMLLAQVGLITLKPGVGLLATPLDIAANPRHLHFEEVDAPFLPRVLPDVDIAVIPANFALQAGLDPLKDALYLESTNSPYANVVVIRPEDLERSEFIRLNDLLHSASMQDFILKKYRGAVVPVGE